MITSSIVGNFYVRGACRNPVIMVNAGWLFVPIRGSVGGFNTEISSCWILIIQLLNKFWWVFTAGLSANWTCTSLVFAQFKSFATLFIVMFITEPIIFFPASSIVIFATLSIRLFLMSFIVKISTSLIRFSLSFLIGMSTNVSTVELFAYATTIYYSITWLIFL